MVGQVLTQRVLTLLASPPVFSKPSGDSPREERYESEMLFRALELHLLIEDHECLRRNASDYYLHHL